MSDLVSRLRDLSACKHDDLSIGNEAADRIEALERELAEAQNHLYALRRLTVEQAEDQGLWFNAEHISESLLQAALRKLHAAIETVDPEYAKRNPLGGPARMFDVIADRIRAGEDYHAVLKDYGLDAEAQRDAGRYRLIRDNFPSLLLWDGWPTQLPDGALTAEFVDAAVDDLAKARGA